MNDVFPSKYMKSEDFPHPDVLQIRSVGVEEVGVNRDRKVVVYFKDEEKGLILNKTVYTQIAEIAQNDDTDYWNNVQVEVYVDHNVFYQGKRTPGLRCRAPKSQQGGQPRQPQAQMAPADAVYDEEIPDPGPPMTGRARRQAAGNPPF